MNSINRYDTILAMVKVIDAALQTLHHEVGYLPYNVFTEGLYALERTAHTAMDEMRDRLIDERAFNEIEEEIGT